MCGALTFAAVSSTSHGNFDALRMANAEGSLWAPPLPTAFRNQLFRTNRNLVFILYFVACCVSCTRLSIPAMQRSPGGGE